MITVAVFEPKALVDTIPVPGAQMSMQSLTINVHIADRARGIKGEMEGMKACECDRGSRKEA